MKILVVCQHYYPEPFRITDICEYLVKQGHDVKVITGIPNYPEGVIYDGYNSKETRDEIINGVRVHRCFTVPRKTGFVFRILNYYSYAFSSSRYTSSLKEKFDVVLVNQLSPVMMAKAAIAYKKKHSVKMVLYCLDLWPESLTAGGVKKGSIVYRIFHRVSQKIYRKADKILISSKSFSRYFAEEFDIKETEYLPQYAEEIFDKKMCRRTADEKVNLMFAGNVGAAQSVETIIKAADKTRNIKSLFWHIVGDGSELENIKNLTEKLQLDNVIFHGRHPLEDMPKYYSMADAMLVTMKKDDVISMTLPGKIQTYMAAGKAIIGAIDGETATVIRESESGMCCSAEDSDALARIAIEFMECDQRTKFGECSRAFYETNYSKSAVMKKLIEALENTKG